MTLFPMTVLAFVLLIVTIIIFAPYTYHYRDGQVVFFRDTSGCHAVIVYQDRQDKTVKNPMYIARELNTDYIGSFKIDQKSLTTVCSKSNDTKN